MWLVVFVDWLKWYGYCFKILYCVMNGIMGEYMDDLKICMLLKVDEINKVIVGWLWFSIGDWCWIEGGMKEVL